MALRKNADTPETESFAICLDACCVADEDGVPHYFARGERVRASHWAVSKAAPLFAADGEPDSHYRNLLSRLYGDRVE
jgi:hypothetical protein